MSLGPVLVPSWIIIIIVFHVLHGMARSRRLDNQI